MSSVGGGAIVLAAGRSERMGGADKLLATLGGRPLIAHAIEAFTAHTGIDALVVVASGGTGAAIGALTGRLAPRARVVRGGERRRDSVRAGLDALADCDYVVVHDGARPLVTKALIDAALAGGRAGGGAARPRA